MSPGRAAATEAPLWDELVAAALLGTERRMFRADDLPEELAGLPGVGTDLIAAASAVWAFREAGRAPAAARGGVGTGGAGRGMPVPRDDRPLLRAGALRALTAVMGDRRFRPLLPEWLGLAATRGGRVPAEMVPALLATRRPDRADEAALICRVAGPLAAWLGARNPDWAWALEMPGAEEAGEWDEPALEAAWRRGDDQRLAAFSAVRRADPRLARQFLHRVWGDEPPGTRAALVAALVDGLSLDDEPFLAPLLEDRRKDVRRAAATLLSKMTGSQLMISMEAQALPRVRIEGRLRPTLHVDGSDGGPPWAEIVGATRLAAWPEHLRRAPVDLVRLALRSGATGLVAGWAAAAVAQRDEAWAEALVAGGAPPGVDLIGVMAPEAADRSVIALVQEWSIAQALELALARPAPWSAALTTAVLSSLHTLMASGDMARAMGVREALPRVALALDPGQLPAVTALAGASDRIPEAKRAAVRSFWEKRVADLLAVVHFRHAMYQEFR